MKAKPVIIDKELIIYCYSCIRSGVTPICDKNKLYKMQKYMEDNIDVYGDTTIYQLLNHVLEKL